MRVDIAALDARMIASTPSSGRRLPALLGAHFEAHPGRAVVPWGFTVTGVGAASAAESLGRMRNKIIAVNAVIVALVGLLSFVIVRQSIMTAASSPAALTDRAKQDVHGASAQVQLDGLRAERWLAAKAQESETQSAVSRATPEARRDAVIKRCDDILGQAKKDFSSSVALVMVVDTSGRLVGRNGVTTVAAEDIGARYPLLKTAATKGLAGSDVWPQTDREAPYLASYVPIRDEQNHAAGSLVLGVPLNDELRRLSDGTSSKGLVLVVGAQDKPIVAATSTGTPDDVKGAADKAVTSLKSALAAGNIGTTVVGELSLAAAPLEGLGDGKGAAIVVAAPASLVEDAGSKALPILLVSALGLVLVLAGGWFLGSYISEPIATLEEGLLAILNGQSDKRFELEHAELGGLAFRIDQLLNQLMGIEEDNTDDEGRVSKAPTAASFNDAMSVDKSAAGVGETIDPAVVKALAEEAADSYYVRLYNEYIAAKKALGEQTDHISLDAFKGRVQGMEQDAHQKHGRTVRYRIQTADNQVNFLAVPLN